jgi:long-chain acyl-CoA synthetase
MVRRRSLFANLDTIAQVLSVACRSRLFNDMVLAHADGMVQGPLLALSTGATLIRAGGFGVDRMEAWLDTVRREGATHFTTVPTVWALIDRYAQHADYFATPGFKALSSVAAHLDAELWARTEQRFGHPLTNQYGLTETVASALFAGPHPQAGERFGVGLPVGGAARIEALAAGDAVGELQLQGDHLFAGYWGDEEATAQAFTSDGWLRTGDLARQDERGQFHIVGRLKRIINSGGFLIRPEELDEAMLRHPAVLGAATLAWPDELFGEVPVTAIVLADASVDETALTAHARASLEPKKVPKRIVVIDDMPRGDAGKPRLDRVRELVAERVQAGEVMAGTQAAAERLDHALIETAARVFRVDAATLSLRSSPETVDSWDSFQQIALIVALESRFGVRIPAGRAASIRSLASALEAIEMARRS